MGPSHACGLTRSGDLYCWGERRDGKIGDGLGSVVATRTPQPVTGGHRFRSITASTGHTCAIDLDDVAWCWGAGDSGALGDGGVSQFLIYDEVAAAGQSG